MASGEYPVGPCLGCDGTVGVEWKVWGDMAGWVCANCRPDDDSESGSPAAPGSPAPPPGSPATVVYSGDDEDSDADHSSDTEVYDGPDAENSRATTPHRDVLLLE